MIVDTDDLLFIRRAYAMGKWLILYSDIPLSQPKDHFPYTLRKYQFFGLMTRSLACTVLYLDPFRQQLLISDVPVLF